MPEITILSMFNGRYHKSVIKRAERVCQIAVDGEVVYDDELENKLKGLVHLQLDTPLEKEVKL